MTDSFDSEPVVERQESAGPKPPARLPHAMECGHCGHKLTKMEIQEHITPTVFGRKNPGWRGLCPQCGKIIGLRTQT